MTGPVWLALLLHLAAGYLYVLSGLVAPPYAVIGLLVVWVLLLWWLFRIRHQRWKTLVVPAAAVVIWFTVLMLGDFFLGWTA